MHGISGSEAMAKRVKKAKAIHVITRFDKGGSAENTYLTVRGLDKERYDVCLIRGLSQESRMSRQEATGAEGNLAEAEKSGVRIITIPELVRNIAPVKDLKAFFRLMRIFRHENPDIVHTHTSKAGILGRWAAYLLAKRPIIIHTPHGHTFWGYFNRWETFAFIFFERLTARITDHIITLTGQERKDHLRFAVAAEEKFTVIHSGVDLRNFLDAFVDPAKMKEKLGIPQNSFVVGTVGRLTPVKGQKYLIEAAAKVIQQEHNSLFVFLGDGELLAGFAETASVLGIKDHLRFLGWRPDVADVMSTFDVFVLPSLNEGMGKVIVEAMAMGKPVIASDVGGIPDLVVHGENGLLVPPADSEALVHAILDLYENHDKRRSMGEAGKKTAAEYGVDAMLRKIDDLYKMCLTVS
ncbi:MAG: glycosyltransferase family 4 protein [Pseudomonadota bacterium]